MLLCSVHPPCSLRGCKLGRGANFRQNYCVGSSVVVAAGLGRLGTPAAVLWTADGSPKLRSTLRPGRLPGSRRKPDKGDGPHDCNAGAEEIGPGWTLVFRQPQPHE